MQHWLATLAVLLVVVGGGGVNGYLNVFISQSEVMKLMGKFVNVEHNTRRRERSTCALA